MLGREVGSSRHLAEWGVNLIPNLEATTEKGMRWEHL